NDIAPKPSIPANADPLNLRVMTPSLAQSERRWVLARVGLEFTDTSRDGQGYLIRRRGQGSDRPASPSIEAERRCLGSQIKFVHHIVDDDEVCLRPSSGVPQHGSIFALDAHRGDFRILKISFRPRKAGNHDLIFGRDSGYRVIVSWPLL